MDKKKALLVITDGSEEMEAVISIDILRRAGVDVMIASLSNNILVTCSRNVMIRTDALFTEVKQEIYDAVILPGGLKGAEAFAASSELGILLKKQYMENRVIAAICAAPIALKAHDIGKGKSITCYPTIKDQLSNEYNYLDNKIVIADNLITGQGPAATFHFALAIVEKLMTKETAGTVAKEILYHDYPN
ncbi:hypothetical protein HN011_008656 [Eciton burchellii]|nr:hypothetical protein HN011_008656 [Eciton burchellii]